MSRIPRDPQANAERIARLRAHQEARKWPLGMVDTDALEAAALVGAWEALETWDPGRGSFSTHVFNRVHFALKHELRRQDYLKWSVRQDATRAMKAAEELPAWMLPPLSLDSPVREDGEGDTLWVEALEDRESSPAEEVTRSLLRDRFLACVRRLPERDAEAVRLHYWEDMTLREIGERLGCSQEGVRQILVRARRLLGPILLAEGLVDQD